MIETVVSNLFKKFDIPVKVVPPAFRYPVKTYGNPEGRNPRGAGGFSNQGHGGLFRGPPPFHPIAVDAAGDDILPFGLTTSGLGEHMVVSQFFRSMPISAVLTSVAIPCINVLPGKLDRAFMPFDHLEQADHRGEFESKADGVNIEVVLFDHLHLPEAEHGNGLFPVDNLQRLVGDV